MRDIVKLGAVLMIFCAVAAGALAFTNNVTAPIIEEQERIATQNALLEVFPAADEFDERNDLIEQLQLDKTITTVYQAKSGGADVGLVVIAAPAGYGGPIRTMVGIDDEGKITSIKVLNHTETPGLGARITEPWFEQQFAGKTADKPIRLNNDGGDIDSITAATISARAVADGVNEAVQVYNKLR